ncbi:MAG: hypothetical protein AAF675_01350 [Pseudomonadota bacterium]
MTAAILSMAPTGESLHVFALLSLIALSGIAQAQAVSALTTAEIEALISGNTVSGAMASSGRYSEFYAADGTIRAEGYTGSWRIEGDCMWFDYGRSTECWVVGAAGGELVWMKDGEIGGTGTLLKGNPNDY